MGETTLADCPFCWESAPTVREERGFVYVECVECYARTAAHATEEKAVIAWNTRPAPVASPPNAGPDIAQMVDDVFDGKRDIRDVLRELRPVVPAPAASRPSAEPSEAATLLDVLPDAADPIWETHARMCGSPNPLLFHREFCRVLVALSARPAAGSETRKADAENLRAVIRQWLPGLCHGYNVAAACECPLCLVNRLAAVPPSPDATTGEP
jgi:hypothetical protein